LDVAYKRYLNKFAENKEKEAKKKKKEEDERQKSQKSQQPQVKEQPSIREITAEEAERIKNEQNKPKEEKMEVDDEAKIPEEKKEGEENDKGPKAGHVMPGPGNGNAFEKYSWTQLLIHEINVMIPVPGNIKGKELIVEHDAKYLKVQIKGQPEPILEGELCKPMNVSTNLTP
jgi:hypothetical protein